VLPGSSPITTPFLLRKLTRSKGPSLHRHYPASQVPLTLSDAQMVRNPFRSRSQVATLSPSRASPTDRRLPSWHAVLTTPVVPPVPMVIGLARSRAGFFRMGSAFPALAPGRHHIGSFGACSSFTRVTACQVARPPFRGLCHEVPIRPVSQPHRSPAIESNHQLFEWVLPPLVICPFRAHAKARPPTSPAQVHHCVRPHFRNGEFSGAFLHAVVFERGAGMAERRQPAAWIRA